MVEIWSDAAVLDIKIHNSACIQLVHVYLVILLVTLDVHTGQCTERLDAHHQLGRCEKIGF